MSYILFADDRQGMCTEDDIKSEDAQNKKVISNGLWYKSLRIQCLAATA
jgi:hypothetical protein